MSKAFRLGVVINPFAGIGGAMALKGSDGEAIRQQALAAGDMEEIERRARLFAAALQRVREEGEAA